MTPREILIIPSPKLDNEKLKQERLRSVLRVPGVVRGTVDIPGTSDYYDYDDRDDEGKPRRKSYGQVTDLEKQSDL